MAFQNTQKMSLMCQYDDLCRYTKVLTAGCEEEFKTFVEGQLDYFKKWKDSESEMLKMRGKISKLEADKKRLETQIKSLKSIHLEAENRRRRIELERNSLANQIAIVKDLLDSNMVTVDIQAKDKLDFLSSKSSNSPTRLETIAESTGSVLSLSDIDRTEDDLLFDKPISSSNARRSKGKRSGSEGKIVQKKKKTESLYLEPTSDENEISNVPQKKVTVRCNSEPASTSPESDIFPRSFLKSDSTQNKTVLPYELRKSSSAPMSVSTPNARYSTGGKLSRQHIFVTKTLYRPEKCNPCRNNIGFFSQALKCQDCAVICHMECKDKCPIPCIPKVHTPTEKATGTIADYTSAAAPMIPPLIVHCINEIESRGLGEKGLYRISGSDREVKILKEKFLNGRSIPLLHKHDISAICSAIKEFLRSLSEPLVTRSAWQEFVHAADLEDTNKSSKAMHDIVSSLPQPNRDTLAFLILHLQRVAVSPDCKMPISSLAKIFGPTVIGYSVPDPAELNVLRETKDQCKVMDRLLSIPPEFWNSLLNIEPDVFPYSLKKTPENTPGPKGGTRLGPFAPPGQRVKTANFNRTPTSRNSRSTKSGKMFFTSPHLK